MNCCKTVKEETALRSCFRERVDQEGTWHRKLTLSSVFGDLMEVTIEPTFYCEKELIRRELAKKIASLRVLKRAG